MGAEGKTKEEMEAEISTAMRTRVSDFKDKADSLTLEGVRRLLEKDLGMKTFSLDVYKKFIKQCLEKYFYDSSDATELNISKSTEANAEEPVHTKASDEKMHHDNFQPTNKLENIETEINNAKEYLPQDEKQLNDQKAKYVDGIESDIKIGEDTIAKAIKMHATYLRDNSASITMSGVRRLLEEDLKLANKALDPHKIFIKNQLEEVLTTEAIEPKKEDKKRIVKKDRPTPNKRKGNEKSSKKSRESEDTEELSYQSESHSGSDEGDAEEEKPKKRSAKEIKVKATGVAKKQKISTESSKQLSHRKKKQAELITTKSVDSNDGSEDGSEDDHSRSSVEEDLKRKKDNQTLSSYGKKVEALKSTIKSCGMSVPPSVYKRVKQAPENEREASLIRELEGILDREGLSSNPSEKEIKSVRKQKQRAKELEGIDMSNIVSSSRRRTTSNFIPPKPQIPVLSESEEEEEEEEENSDEENSNEEPSSEGSDQDAEESD